ncbi:MAG: DUF1592 domain-containing protein [Vicinamibacterales bacterium]
MHLSSRSSAAALAAVLASGWAIGVVGAQSPAAQRPPVGSGAAVQGQASPARADHQATIRRYCVTCHNQRLKTAGLTLDTIDAEHPALNPDEWERVVMKLRSGSMPPTGVPRPDAAAYAEMIGWLEGELDRAWAAAPNPGRIGAVHRLNRTQYNNAIRDLFALRDVDVRAQLPGDETADGSFDNFADSLSISTAHLERYLSVARQVTRLATGLPPTAPTLDVHEVPLHVVQDDRQSEDLPLGSRGGIAVRHHVPVDGEYTITVKLRRQYQDYLMGMGWPQRLDVRVDGRLVKRFTVGGGAKGRAAAASYAGDGEPNFAGDPEWEEYMQVGGDAGLDVRVPLKAGPRVVGVSFVREQFEPEGLPQPLQRGRVLTNDQLYMDNAAVGAVQVGGPFGAVTPASSTPSARAIFSCRPAAQADEPACASRILARIGRLAYRRPLTKADTDDLLAFFRDGRRNGGSFEAGIQFALERMLVDPDFLLRVHRDPPELKAGGARPASYAMTDLEIASRLSFFLWASLPDARLLDRAEKGQLTTPAVLEAETMRMLADPRAVDTLATDFAAQWLNLRRVGDVVAHPDVYPSFDDSLLEAFRTETELFVASTVRENRSVLDLIRADYTYVNERLARHYNFPGISGSRFRRVTVPDITQRGGVLAHGSLLATTSYPERTSPVLRGKWLLENIFGVTVPPPPPGVNVALAEAAPGTRPPTIRERLAQHRKQPVCASCHAVIDPAGFALENFDAIGGYRLIDESGKPVDAVGSTVDGTPVNGLPGLRALLLNPQDKFPHTVTTKLMAYALGRPLEHFDRPAVRRIVRDAAPGGYTWSSIVLGIVKSPSFLRRAVPAATN